MAVRITHSQPIDPPIEQVVIEGSHATRSITVRPTYSSDDPSLLTIECADQRYILKWATTLDNVEQFGAALVRFARERRAAL